MSSTPANLLQRRLDAILDSTGEGILGLDEDAIIRSLNPAAARLFAHLPAAILGQPVSSLVPALALAETHAQTLEGLRADGSRFTVEVSLRELEGEPDARWLLLVRDASLRVRSTRLQLASTAAGVGIWDWDVVHNQLIWDAQMYRLYGIRAEDFSGAYAAWRAGLHPEDAVAGDAAVAAALAGEREFDAEFRVVWPDGSIHTLKAYAQIERDARGQALRMVGTNWDITAAKRAEAALARKHEEVELAARFDRIGAQVMLALSARTELEAPRHELLQILAREAGYRPLALYTWDEEHQRLDLAAGLSLSPSAASASFALDEGLVGEVARAREPVFIDDGPAGPFALETGFGLVQVSTLFALPLIHGDELLGVLAGASQARVEARERSWLTQIVGQITIGLYAILEYRELRILSDELDERARTIEAQNLELAQANRMKSEFLTTMSHELRTPLNAIIGFTNILLKNKHGNLLAKDLSFLARVLANGKHLLSLINDILNLSKFEAGRLELEFEDVELEDLVGEVLAEIGVHSPSEGLHLVGNVPPELAPVHADRRRLKQVLINLVGNAIKFTEAGIVEVRVRSEGSIPVRIDVIDSGIGIPQAELGSVMEAFRQLDNSTARRYGGSGLGLTISKTFCAAMGYELALDSVEGEGTLVAVVLSQRASPVRYEVPAREGSIELSPPSSPSIRARAPTPTPAPSSGRAPAELRKKLSSARHHTTLVIDDDPDSRAVIEQYLDEFGCRVITVDSGRRGIEVARAVRPSLVILDLMMQGMNGLAVLKVFREDPVLHKIPVVICSVVAGEYRYQLSHAVDVLTKPIDRDTLGALVERLRGKGRRLLIVEDDLDAQALFTEVAEELGLEVKLAENGQLGLEALDAEAPDLILLDLNMPVLDGFGFLTGLRARPRFATTPVIVCTAASLDQDQRQQLERAAHVIAKGDGATIELRELLMRVLIGR